MAHDPRSQLFPLSSSLRKRKGSSFLTGLPEPTPKRRKAKEPVLSADSYVPDPNLGSRLEETIDLRHRQIQSEQTPPKGSTAKESVKGSSAVDIHHIMSS
jgi:hypothetical protein